MIDYEALFKVISKRLEKRGLITHQETIKIERRRSRKFPYHRRHIIDLCNYTLGKMERNNIVDEDGKAICQAGLKLARDP
jgi:hypothetical protein